MSRRVLQSVRNDRRSLGMMIVAPIMAMFVFGIAFSGDVRDVPVAVVQKDSDVPVFNQTFNLGENITARLDPAVLKITRVADEAEAVAMVERGEARAAILIPLNFTRDALAKAANASYSGNNTTVSLRLDRSNVNIAATIQKQVADALLKSLEAMGRSAPVKIDDSHPVYGEHAKFIDFLIPGVMTFAVFLITNLLTITGFVEERNSGTFERLMASPVTEAELILGYSTAWSAIALLQSAIILSVAILAFQITIVGSVVLAFFIIALLAVASQALGILLSSAARTEAQAIQFLPFLVLPVFLLAGIFWPVEAIPREIRPLSNLVPPTHAVEALRSVLVRGWGIDRVWPQVVALALFGTAFLLLAWQTMRRSKR